MANRFRNEHKYLLNKAEMAILRMRLEAFVEKDPHLMDRSSYLIRSIYFDDFDNSCLHEKEDGVGTRQKWRIRSYNCDDSLIHLECKKKIKNMSWKDSIAISRREFDAAIHGDIIVDKNRDQLWNQFALLVTTKGYHPVTIVQYDRVPYVWPFSNVRITLDGSLSSSEMFEQFFEADLPVRPVMPQNMELLEVKYDTLLPDYLRHILNMENMRMTSFSKYEICRRLRNEF